MGADLRRWACAVLIAIVISFLVLPAALAQTGIKIDAKPGVSSTHFKYITIAINNITRFFSDNYKIALQKRMRIIIAPDNKTYEEVLLKDFGYPPATAQKDARLTAGKAREGKVEYLLLIKARPSDPVPWIIELACHEIVHWYQFQVAGLKKVHEVKWIEEGCANVIAFQIVGTMTDKTLDKYRQERSKVLKKAASLPSLKDLHSPKDWNAATDKYGGNVVYSKATLAALELSRRQGGNSIFNYFLKLQQQTPIQAFEQAFGLELHKFESEMDQKLNNNDRRK